MRKITIIFFFCCCSQSILTFGQQLNGDQFKLTFSTAGLSSFKRAQDVFDTDYILAGRTLGDVLVRYRTPGEAWQEVSSGTALSRSTSGDEVTYQIGTQLVQEVFPLTLHLVMQACHLHARLAAIGRGEIQPIEFDYRRARLAA